MRNAFSATCFAVNRQQSDSSLKFDCRNLTSHTGGVGSIEFSADGTLLASGGVAEPIVRLGSINQAVENVIEMKTRHGSPIFCLANVSILFCYEFTQPEILIYKFYFYTRTKSINAIGNLKCVRSISLKLDSAGNIFAVACEDTVLRIFDIRSRTTRKLI